MDFHGWSEALHEKNTGKSSMSVVFGMKMRRPHFFFQKDIHFKKLKDRLTKERGFFFLL